MKCSPVQVAKFGLILSALIAPLALAAEVAAGDTPSTTPKTTPASDGVGENDIDIVIGGQPTKGRVVLPPTENEFKFKLADTGTVVSFRWSQLDEYERKRVQKLYGMEVASGRLVFGNKIVGAKLKLKSGKFMEGLPIPDRDRVGMKALRTATAPLMMIPMSEIVSEEPFEAYQSDFYSAGEVYDLRLLEKPPGNADAGAHLEFSRWAASIGLYGKAVEHLEQAKIIDPRTEERNQEFRERLLLAHANQQAQELFDIMLREMRGGDFLSALDRVQTLKRTFKNSDFISRCDALLPIIEAGSKTEINKRIVTLSYRIALELVEKKLATKIRVDDKGYPVDVIPGKQVTTRTNVFRGVLVAIGGNTVDNSNMVDEYMVKEGIATPKTGAPAQPAAKGANADDVTLKMGNSTITIAGKEILSITDCDLSVASKTSMPTFDQLKEYVTSLNGADGLKAEMCKRIARVVKISDKEVKKIFDNRLEKEGEYRDGKLTMTKSYDNFHEVFWGAGSWLRPGSKPMKYVKYDSGVGKSSTGRTYNNKGQLTNGRNGGNNNPANNQAIDDDETSESTDDPAIWWKFQEHDTQLGTLKAMMAEKVFKTDTVQNKSCHYCGGHGKIQVTLTGGNLAEQRCPLCRGLGVMYKIIYH